MPPSPLPIVSYRITPHRPASWAQHYTHMHTQKKTYTYVHKHTHAQSSPIKHNEYTENEKMREKEWKMWSGAVLVRASPTAHDNRTTPTRTWKRCEHRHRHRHRHGHGTHWRRKWEGNGERRLRLARPAAAAVSWSGGPTAARRGPR